MSNLASVPRPPSFLRRAGALALAACAALAGPAAAQDETATKYYFSYDYEGKLAKKEIDGKNELTLRPNVTQGFYIHVENLTALRTKYSLKLMRVARKNGPP